MAIINNMVFSKADFMLNISHDLIWLSTTFPLRIQCCCAILSITISIVISTRCQSKWAYYKLLITTILFQALTDDIRIAIFAAIIASIHHYTNNASHIGLMPLLLAFVISIIRECFKYLIYQIGLIAIAYSLHVSMKQTSSNLKQRMKSMQSFINDFEDSIILLDNELNIINHNQSVYQHFSSFSE